MDSLGWKRIEALRARLEGRSIPGDLFPDNPTAAEPELIDDLPAPTDTVEQKASLQRLTESLSPLPRRTIGPYEVLRELGRGGMGVVYLAARADKQYEQQVAIKVLRAQGGDSNELLWRFKSERQILANLDHPHICRLLDGGVTDAGEPYFVMEFVRGARKLDVYCLEENLSLPQRLAIFQQVCAAVQYAHQHLIIHRDLKPANILVRDDGQVKLMDFGIAKNLLALGPADRQGQTVAGLQPMTPEYASPEQARGEPLGTATDIYSLGVVLYELLTDRHPYPTDVPFAALLRSICEQEPEWPSTVVARRPATQSSELRKRLKGDLDWIVMMALHKEPKRRYSSVEQFSEDIHRHLEGRPVQAHPHTTAYRLERFLRRQRAAVGATSLVLLAVTGGVVSTVHQANVAKARFQDVRDLANSFLFEFHDAVAPLAGSTAARQLVARKGVEYLDRLASESRGDRSLQIELAAAYARMGDVQAGLDRANLGDTKGAANSYEKSRTLYLALGPESLPPDARAQFGSLLLKMGDLSLKSGQIATALQQYGSAREVAATILAAHPGNQAAEELLARSLESRSDAWLRKGNSASALADLQQALPLARSLVMAYPARRDLRRLEWTTHRKLGAVLARRGKFQEAIPEIELAQKLIRSYRDTAHVDADAKRDLSLAARLEGDTRMDLGQDSAALSAYELCLSLAMELAEADPADATARRDLAIAYTRRADLVREQGQKDQALQDYGKSLAIFREAQARDPQNKELLRDQRICLTSLGRVYADQKKPAEALNFFQQAVSLAEQLIAADPQNRQWQGDLGLTLDRLARVWLDGGDYAKALTYYRRERSITGALLAADPNDFEARRRHVLTLDRIGECVEKTQSAAAAVPDFQEALKIVEQANNNSHQASELKLQMLNRLGEALTRMGKRAEAKSVLQQAISLSEQPPLSDPKHPTPINIKAHVANAYGLSAIVLSQMSEVGDARRHAARSLALYDEVLAIDPKRRSAHEQREKVRPLARP